MIPTLHVGVTESEATDLQDRLRASGPGSDARWIPPDEIASVCHWIDRPVAGGLLEPNSVRLDPALLT